jgi:uncharacterized protein YmfQ (DUF2313 family)
MKVQTALEAVEMVAHAANALGVTPTPRTVAEVIARIDEVHRLTESQP